MITTLTIAVDRQGLHAFTPQVQSAVATSGIDEGLCTLFIQHTSASLVTRGKASWTYGRIEVRAKLPGGRGTWPAIWTLGADRRQ